MILTGQGESGGKNRRDKRSLQSLHLWQWEVLARHTQGKSFNIYFIIMHQLKMMSMIYIPDYFFCSLIC